MSRAGDYGPGLYFATDIRDAREYGPYVYRAVVTVKYPLQVGFELTHDMDRIRRALRIGDEDLELHPGEPPWHVVVEYAKTLISIGMLDQKRFQDLIIRVGYDSIYVPNAAITYYPHGAHIKGDYLIAFDTNQASDWKLFEEP
jgi:hypothetical protein